MLSTKSKSTHAELDHILNFVDGSKGLRAKINESGRVQIRQDLDGKLFSFNSTDVSEVLHRADSEGKPFIQVNFKNSTKVLLTETLVGFKPCETLGLDMARIPKVVTTPDLVSVFEAIEESLGADGGADQETEILKKVYLAIVTGGEKVGFDLEVERQWLNRLLASKLRASA
ncbi:hypothetical protein AZI86_10505 [Bdellovibrio bacteriovorus]|uniref:Uncharacterized protein n=1 Tax=Bdellovibrio bacteriovorus TaxID=959 RepID=A0A150WSC4_BDEBC|nr:hypothetical protein AZI86_10505 [Bdellovibrio bacteriovorus]